MLLLSKGFLLCLTLFAFAMRLPSLCLMAIAARRACEPRLCVAPDDSPRFEITLTKPLGIAFEEIEHTGGLEVGEVLAGGSAVKDGTIWPGDLLLAVGQTDVSRLALDEAMAALMDAPETVTLELGRVRGRAAAVRFPDGPLAGKLLFVTPGTDFLSLAKRSRCEVEYQCYEGSCGVCDMVLKDGETEELRPVRFCRARVPQGSQASLMPWEVLRPESDEAQRYYARMEAKMMARRRRKPSQCEKNGPETLTDTD